MADSTGNNQQKTIVNQALLEDSATAYPGAFSATDISALITLPGGVLRPLGNIAALSISTHRDAFPVTSMRGIGIRGVTQGHRTIAGTLMFHTIDRSAFAWAQDPSLPSAAQPSPTSFGAFHPDTLPLFDIYFTYVNDIGMFSSERLLGIRILDFGKTISMENPFSIESYSYMALDYLPLSSMVQPASAQVQLQKLNPGKSAPVISGSQQTYKGFQPDAIPSRRSRQLSTLPGLQDNLSGLLPPVG